MKKRYYKLIDKKMQWIKIKTLIILFLSFFCVQYSFSTDDIGVWPYEIKFDYETGHSNDAINIRKDVNDDVSVPEWINWAQRSGFAYIKGQSNRKIQVRFNSNCDSMHLLINFNVVSGTGFGEICNFFVANYYKLDWITLTLEGSVPNSVDIRNFTWEWEIYAISNDPAYCSDMSDYNTYHSYYTLLATPQAPMAEPWTDVLDYACDWASGQSTDAGVLSSLTSGLYNSGLDYDGFQSHYKLNPPWPNTTKTIFDLTDFLDDWNKADCQDCGMFLSIISSSLGASLTQSRRISGSFYTNLIDPLGSTYSWVQVSWVFHHVGWFNNVYDPSIRLDYDNTEYIPINKNIYNPYEIDLRYSGYFIPRDPFKLGQTDPYWDVPSEIQ